MIRVWNGAVKLLVTIAAADCSRRCGFPGVAVACQISTRTLFSSFRLLLITPSVFATAQLVCAAARDWLSAPHQVSTDRLFINALMETQIRVKTTGLAICLEHSRSASNEALWSRRTPERRAGFCSRVPSENISSGLSDAPLISDMKERKEKTPASFSSEGRR